MKLFFSISIIIIIIILFFYLINLFINNIENFDIIYGAVPIDNGTAWGNYAPPSECEDSLECDPGSICMTEDGFGVFNKYCECIIGKKTIYKDTQEEEEEEIKIPTIKFKKLMSVKEKVDLTGCYPNNTNFDKICKEKGPMYGIKDIIPCNEDYSRVECEKNFINKKNYGESMIMTPCLNKSDDFDVWCKYYNNNPVPKGFNVNSIASKEVLVGEKGDCYLNNGKSDENKARAICDYNHMQTLEKLYPNYYPSNYNDFTRCLPINSNFVKECSKILNSEYKKTSALDIMGYDCNPGYARAKCFLKKDARKILSDYANNEFVKSKNCKC